MLVAVDGRALQHRPASGVGRGLSEILARMGPGVDIEVLTNARLPDPSPWPRHPVQPLTFAGSSRTAVWLEAAVPRHLVRRGGIFHGTFNVLPRWLPVPAVVTIHDLSFELFPAFFSSRARRLVMRSQARWAAQAAARVLTVSHHEREVIIDRYNVAPDRIAVAPNAVSDAFHPQAGDRAAGVLEQLGVRSRYFVALGGAPRRNLPLAIAAWQAIAGRDVALVVVGPEDPATPGVTWAGPIDDWRWPALLAGAVALCYPTAYESFGMPALEAAACGTPVVATRVGALSEVLDDTGVWCDELRAATYAEAMEALLEEGERRRVSEATLAAARTRPTWNDSAAVVREAYEAASHSQYHQG